MATDIIDAFVATLGLDSTQFDKNAVKAKKTQQELAVQANKNSKDREGQDRKLSDSEKKYQKESEARAKSTKEGFAKVRNEVLLLVGAFTAGVGIKDFFSSTINTAANLGYLSANLGMTTERIQAYQRASERAGGTAEGMTAQLKESVDTLAQLKLGMGPSEGLQWFFRMGGSSSDLQNGNTYLMARSKIIHDMFQVDPGKAALMARQMGISEDQFNLIKQGPQAVQALIAAQEKHSAITEKDAAAALDLRNKMLDLLDSLKQTATKIVVALAPAITIIIAKFADWADKLGNNKEEIDKIGAALFDFLTKTDWSKVISEAKEFAASVKDIADSIKQIIDRWDEWTGKPKIQVPGVTYLPGAIKVGTKEAMDRDAIAHGRTPSTDNGEPKNEALRTISDGIEMAVARTLASFGVRSGAEFVRDKTGQDLYGIGPKETEKSIMGKLVALGWTKEQAAGIAGSLKQESNLDPSVRNSISGAYGIAQWLSKDRISNFEKIIGKPLKGSTVDDQLKFQQWELTQGPLKDAGDKLRAAKTAEEAALIHRKFYEKPGEGEANDAARQKYAAQFAQDSRAQNATSAAKVPAGSGTSVASKVDNSKSSSSTSDTTINGGITIVTQATDTKGIASEIKPAIEKYNSTMQANTGIR